MVNVDIDEDLYESIKSFIKTHRYDYSSIKFFVQKAVYKELSSEPADDFYARIKDLIAKNPKLKIKVDDVFKEELRKVDS